MIHEISSGGKTFNFEYDESNNRLSRTYADSTQDVYAYNEANQVVKTQTLDGTSQPKWSSRYTYDADGQTAACRWILAKPAREGVFYLIGIGI